ncbi:hypothetical protein DITRI_Ditri14bG0010500 [Diplodiscus trichospermus]
MAAASQIFQNHHSDNNNNNKNEVSRKEIQAAISKAVELRALHAALMHGNSRYTSSASPVSQPVPQFSAQDYPVFTPSYEKEALSGYHSNNQASSESWDEYGMEAGNGDETVLSDHNKEISVSSKGMSPALTAIENVIRNLKNSNTEVPITDSQSYIQSQPKNRGVISWLFPGLKKKQKNENSHNQADQSEEVLQTLRTELIEANENREAALMEVAETSSSLGELKQKLECLETYCEELNRALRQAATPLKHAQIYGENLMPVSEEVMTEGFLQIVSEARMSAKRFCKTLIAQIEETDITLMENMDLLLQPYQLSLNSKYSKAVLYHLEAIINRSFYQDFENCVFQKNGSPKHLDPRQDRQAKFSSFVALRNLSWNEVLRKGTKYYSEEFSKFCDQKMSLIISTLNWNRPWPEHLLEAFFVAAKCIWLLHLLAFSFNPPLGILRVEENRSFEPHYMEDMFMERQRSHGPSWVKILVMPGFYVQESVLKCKVVCRYKIVA